MHRAVRSCNYHRWIVRLAHLSVEAEGSLCASWINGLDRTWPASRAGLQNRKLIVDLKNVTAISQDGENAILMLMGQGAKFRSRGVLTRHVLRELARRNRRNLGHPVKPSRPEDTKTTS